MIQELEHKQIKWFFIENPGKNDVKHLRDNFKFHELDLEDLVSHQQRPKIDVYPDYIFSVFNFPVLEGGKICICEVDFFVGADYIITSIQKKFNPLRDLFEKCRTSGELKEKFFRENSKILFYQILDNFIEDTRFLIDNLGKEVDEIDKMVLKKQDTRDIIEKITLLRRNLLILMTFIKPEIGIMTDLEAGKITFSDDNKMATYWSDILDHLRKYYDQLENYRYLLEGLALAHESLISHRINETIKIWTILAGVLLPPTLLASLYGMNIPLPYQHQPWAILFILALMIVNICGMLIYFQRRNWL